MEGQNIYDVIARRTGGDIYIGVMTVINSIRQIAQTPVGALTDGAAPVISYNYGAKKYDKVRRDDISDWKDSDGNWCYPKGYEIQWMPSDDELMASQQFPQELLEDMSTGELYQFIRKAHGFWAQSAFDNYAQMLSYYYCRYNFIAELMRRQDCAEVIHTYYEKTSEDDKKQYSKMASRQFSDGKKLEKQEQFQLLEGLEWFFQYKEGKSVPDDLTFGMQLISTSK